MAYTDTILAESSLVAFWPLQETAGTAAEDVKGTSDGVYTGGYTLNQSGPSASTKSVNFNGSSGWVSITTPPAGTPTTGAYTLEVWVKWVGSGSNDMLFGYGNASSAAMNVLKISTNTRLMSWWWGGGNDFEPDSPALNTTWHHIVTSWDGSARRFYFDGTQFATGSNSSRNSPAVNMRMARQPAEEDNWLNGNLAYVALYNAALSGAAVTAHYAAMSAPDPPTAPTSLTATAVSASAISLTWTASTGTGITGYSVERCSGVGCSSWTIVGTPSGTSFSDTGLTADTSYSYRVRASSSAGYSSYSSTATAVTEEAAGLPAGVVVRSVSASVTFAGVELDDVISARGNVAADSGWPTCSVFVTGKPETGNEEDDLEVVAGAGNNVTRFTGKVRRFRPSAFPKGLEIVGTGTLAYAAEWAPDADLLFDEEFPSGATDQALVAWALGFVPGISYTGANIQGTGITLGTEAPEAFDWKAGVSAWQYVQQLDQATLYRTYQQQDGTIRRVQMIGHPSSTVTTFTLANADMLEGSTGERNTEQTRNAAIVRGHDYGDGLGPVVGAAYGSNDFQGDGATAATRHPESFSSDLIEDGNDEDGTPLGLGGIDAQDIADAVLNDVNKEFVQAQIRSWRDDTHGPGLTCLLDTLDRLAIGEPMWVQGYSWEVDDGWSVTYTLSGGGLEQPYTPAPV